MVAPIADIAFADFAVSPQTAAAACSVLLCLHDVEKNSNLSLRSIRESSAENFDEGLG